MTRQVVCLATDLLGRGRIQSAASHAGVPATFVNDAGSLREALESMEGVGAGAGEGDVLVVVDLHHPRLDGTEAVRIVQEACHGARVVAHGSHVDAARLQSARDAGADEVVPNSGLMEAVVAWLQTNPDV